MPKKTAKNKAVKPKPKTEVKKGPRQKALPGMEDRAIRALQDAALTYAECRDQRIGLSEQEGELKSELLDLMHKHKKTHYAHGSVLIDIVPEGEKLKVRIKKADEVEELSSAPADESEPDVVDEAEEVLEEADEYEEEEPEEVAEL